MIKNNSNIRDCIIELARDQGVHIDQDQSLPEILSAMNLGQLMPIEALATISQIMSYIHELPEGEKE